MVNATKISLSYPWKVKNINHDIYENVGDQSYLSYVNANDCMPNEIFYPFCQIMLLVSVNEMSDNFSICMYACGSFVNIFEI